MRTTIGSIRCAIRRRGPAQCGQARTSRAKTRRRSSAYVERDERERQRFDACICRELVPLIGRDCETPAAEVVAARTSIDAQPSLAAVCRHPDVFKLAICLSGAYDLIMFMDGEANADHHHNTPSRFVKDMPEGSHLDQLRKRDLLLVRGKGNAEKPAQSWRVAVMLGSRRIPSRVVEWGEEWPHDWTTWRKMLSLHLDKLISKPA